MLKNKTIATAVAFAFAAVSASSVMANTAPMHCVNDKGQVEHATTKDECDKKGGKMMTEKDRVVKEDKVKEDKLKQDDKMKEDKMSKEDKAKEDKMAKEDKAKEDKMK